MTKSRSKLRSVLLLRDLQLNVNLGWRKKERSVEQHILLDLDIIFPRIPKACKTDALEDTVCYAELSELIRNEISVKSYRLIEHLSRDIYIIAIHELPKKSKLLVRLTKFPKIAGLLGGVTFEYGER
jgi:dihydroneopterin aldolase